MISNSASDGVLISGSGTSHNVLEGNYIGTTTDGSGTAANGGDGVDIQHTASYNTVGGTTAGALNVISGNTGNGVEINQANDNVVAQDSIGLDSSGQLKNPNGQNGVEIDGGSQSNTIGGTTAFIIGQSSSGTSNVISANGSNGVLVTGSGTSANVVEGNYIGMLTGGSSGTDSDGYSVGNTNDGVLIGSGATSNTIGGTVAGSLNVISNNGTNGVEISGVYNQYNVVVGNDIGTDSSGEQPWGNTNDGVSIDSCAYQNTVGGTPSLARNVISGNANNGVEVDASNNLIEGNYIGTDAKGSSALGNKNDGVLIHNLSILNTIGGTTPGSLNVISGNVGSGVEISGSSGGGLNYVEGNDIGTDSSGEKPLGNLFDGVLIDNGSTYNTVGGTTAAARNVISDNANGVALDSSYNLIEGNYIGTDAKGASALGNLNDGVIIHNQFDLQHGRRDRLRVAQPHLGQQQQWGRDRRFRHRAQRRRRERHRHPGQRHVRTRQRQRRRVHPLPGDSQHDRRDRLQVVQRHLGQRRERGRDLRFRHRAQRRRGERHRHRLDRREALG